MSEEIGLGFFFVLILFDLAETLVDIEK